MKAKILFVILLIALMGYAAPQSAAQCGGPCDEEPWRWAKVEYTELDFRAMGFLWDNWLIPDGGTVAVLPLADYSGMSLVSNPVGGVMSAATRRLCEKIGYEFTIRSRSKSKSRYESISKNKIIYTYSKSWSKIRG